MSQLTYTTIVADMLDAIGVLTDLTILTIVSDCWASGFGCDDCVEFVLNS